MSVLLKTQIMKYPSMVKGKLEKECGESGMKKNLVIFGAGGHGRVAADLFRKSKNFRVIGFLDDEPKKWGTSLDKIRVLGGRDLIPTLKEKRIRSALVALGDGRLREDVTHILEKAGCKMIGIAHPSAVVSRQAIVHRSVQIWPNVVVNAGAEVGEGVILNTGAIIEHDAKIGKYSHVAPGATLCGYVEVGAYSWIGANVTVIQHLSIGTGVMVGAGSVVTKSIPDGVTGCGVPFRGMRG